MDGTIYKRLGVKAEQVIYFPNGHEHFFRKVKALMPHGVKIRKKLAAEEKSDLIFIWPEPGGEWVGLFRVLKVLLKPGGAVWAVIPKKEVAISENSDVVFGNIQNAALRAGLVDNKQSSVSEREYAVRFVRRAPRREVGAG